MSFEFLFQVLDYHFVCRLGLFVTLQIPRSRETELDLPSLAELVEVTRDELGPIVSNDFLWHTEPTDYVSPYEAFDV